MGLLAKGKFLSSEHGVWVGCERSERRDLNVQRKYVFHDVFLSTVSGALKLKQPHPSPPLLPQGRESITTSFSP